MDEQMLRALKEWLRENLMISVELDDQCGPGNGVHIGLRFKHEREDFSRSYVYIPED